MIAAMMPTISLIGGSVCAADIAFPSRPCGVEAGRVELIDGRQQLLGVSDRNLRVRHLEVTLILPMVPVTFHKSQADRLERILVVIRGLNTRDRWNRLDLVRHLFDGGLLSRIVEQLVTGGEQDLHGRIVGLLPEVLREQLLAFADSVFGR